MKIIDSRDSVLSDNTNVQKSNTGIFDSGASDIYLYPDAPNTNFTRKSTPITVGTVTGENQQYYGTATFNLPHLPSNFPQTGHVMHGFKHMLIGIGPLCDAKFTTPFSTDTVIVRDLRGTEILAGWRETCGMRLQRIALVPSKYDIPSLPLEAQQSSLSDFSAYNLLIIEALV